MKSSVPFFLLFLAALLSGLSIGDQLSFYVRESENSTSTYFEAKNSSFHLVLINCIPAVILEQQYDTLYPISENRIEDLTAEYIRRDMRGCNDEVLDLNSSVFSITYQMPGRIIEAKGKAAAYERAVRLQDIVDQRNGLLIRINSLRPNVHLDVVSGKIARMEGILSNLRRVKTDSSIQKLSQDFDFTEYETALLLNNYEKTLPYYYPVAAAYSNISIAYSNVEKRYGEDDAYVRQLSRELLVLDADLTALEKDLEIGEMPPIGKFAAFSSKCDDYRKRVMQRPSLVPPLLVYVMMFACVLAAAAIGYLKLRTRKKIAEEDLPKIRKYLQKLRKVEQQEEESV